MKNIVNELVKIAKILDAGGSSKKWKKLIPDVSWEDRRTLKNNPKLKEKFEKIYREKLKITKPVSKQQRLKDVQEVVEGQLNEKVYQFKITDDYNYGDSWGIDFTFYIDSNGRSSDEIIKFLKESRESYSGGPGRAFGQVSFSLQDDLTKHGRYLISGSSSGGLDI